MRLRLFETSSRSRSTFFRPARLRGTQLRQFLRRVLALRRYAEYSERFSARLNFSPLNATRRMTRRKPRANSRASALAIFAGFRRGRKEVAAGVLGSAMDFHGVDSSTRSFQPRRFFVRNFASTLPSELEIVLRELCALCI